VICLFARRRLSAYLDKALEAGTSRRMVHHLDGCPRCRQEIEGLRRMAVLLRQAIPAAAEPDWTGFWPGIVRGVRDGIPRGAIAVQRRWSRRWVLSGAAVAAVAALSLVVAYEHLGPSGPDESVVVTAADTQYPGGTMVYHTPEKIAVVWVFDE
jgi:anti-sigma factor RsiW